MIIHPASYISVQSHERSITTAPTVPRWLNNISWWQLFWWKWSNNWHISNSLMNGSIKCMPMQCQCNANVAYIGLLDEQTRSSSVLFIICFLYWRLRHYPFNNCHTPTVQYIHLSYPNASYQALHSDIWSVECGECTTAAPCLLVTSVTASCSCHHETPAVSWQLRADQQLVWPLTSHWQQHNTPLRISIQYSSHLTQYKYLE